MNVHAIRAIYRFEMARTFRTWMQSILSPVLSTSLYFVVFGAAIGSRVGAWGGGRRGDGHGRGGRVRLVHHPRPRHAVAARRVDLERVLRDLPAEVLGHD